MNVVPLPSQANTSSNPENREQENHEQENREQNNQQDNLDGNLGLAHYWQVLRWATTHRPYVWASFGDDRDLARGNFPKLIAWANEPFMPNQPDWFEVANALTSDWWFGIIGYEQGQFADASPPTKPKLIDLPSHIGFIPLGIWVLSSDGQTQSIGQKPSLANDPEAFDALYTTFSCPTPLVLKDDYALQLAQVKHWIAAGETYEMNLCIPMLGAATGLDTVGAFQRLTERSAAPFATYFKAQSQYLISASPERFIQKVGPEVWSQPIKGTAPRHPDPVQDQHNADQLASSEKERAENMMIVDLVRNDLAKHAIPGSVKVEAFMALHSFKFVHQLVSTIVARPKPEVPFGEVMRAAFPMGSMTGAPKQRTMNLISVLEPYQRGWFSGSAAYRTPDNNWDMNVVIRSLIYDQNTSQLVLWAGSAITWDSVPEDEYDECMLKAQSIVSILADNGH